MRFKQEPLTEWEDDVLTSLGHDWRTILDQCNFYQDWTQGEINGMRLVCNVWDQPAPSDVRSGPPSTLDGFEKQTPPATKQRMNN